jgi:tetratricopeptide (TPR) repeat protein
VPWELRVLAVRLQSAGFNDPRKGIMGYYDLARDARIQVLKSKSEADSADDENAEEKAEAEQKMWEERLRDLGIRVASALVEMEDLESAARHLSTLPETADNDGGLALQKALLWLKIGDLEAAQHCIGLNSKNGGVVRALGLMADGEYAPAVEAWEQLCATDMENALYKQNLAVCLLYSGRMDKVSLLYFCHVTVTILLSPPSPSSTIVLRKRDFANDVAQYRLGKS